jgi:hypothetical protein
LVLAVFEEILRHEVLAREADDATGREKLTLGPVPQGAYWRFWLSGLFRTNCGRSILDFG